MARITASVGIALGAVALMALPACSKKAAEDDTTETATANTGAPAAATPAATAAPAADSTDTMSGAKFADFKGDATAGEKVFVACKTCHVIDPGVNRIGPSLHAVVGRKAGSIEGFHYSAANKGSGITWTEAKLFQYLEAPQHVVPGTLMTYTGVKDPQQRADVIAYLKAHSS